MSRNEINLDQIQQRLGSSNKPRPSAYDGYDDPAPVNNYSYQQGDDGSTLNAGFIATIVAAFIAVGGGTYFFAGDGFNMPDMGIKLGWDSDETAAAMSGSKLDSVCGKGWQAELPNVDQMHCYLTREAYRLCDSGEHDALLATIRQYDKDYKVWHRKYMMATFKTIGKMQTQGLQLGMEAAKLDNMNGTDKEQMDQFGKVVGVADNIMKPATDVLAQRNTKIPEYELENAAFALAKKGYILASDFGRKKPDFIANALRRAGNVKTACPNRS